jgi:hypothetical protein
MSCRWIKVGGNVTDPRRMGDSTYERPTTTWILTLTIVIIECGSSSLNLPEISTIQLRSEALAR